MSSNNLTKNFYTNQDECLIVEMLGWQVILQVNPQPRMLRLWSKKYSNKLCTLLLWTELSLHVNFQKDSPLRSISNFHNLSSKSFQKSYEKVIQAYPRTSLESHSPPLLAYRWLSCIEVIRCSQYRKIRWYGNYMMPALKRQIHYFHL